MVLWELTRLTRESSSSRRRRGANRDRADLLPALLELMEPGRAAEQLAQDEHGPTVTHDIERRCYRTRLAVALAVLSLRCHHAQIIRYIF